MADLANLAFKVFTVAAWAWYLLGWVAWLWDRR